MAGLRTLCALTIALVVMAGTASIPAAPAWASGQGVHPGQAGAEVTGAPGHLRVWRAPRHARGRATGSFSAPEPAVQQQESSAVAQARQLQRPVAVAGLTTSTQAVLANPNGMLEARSYALPVRVQRGNSWVPVDTALAPATGGMLAAGALPGDAVAFSAGGTGPLAVISAGRRQVALWWPAALPRPVVAGPSATYPNVLPGVDLVLTATSARTGGFSEVLIVKTAQAAADPGLRSLELRVRSQGTRLAAVNGGGLVAPLGGGSAFVAPAPAMWDSPPPGSPLPPAAVAARRAAARAAGARLAPSAGVPLSGVTGPGPGALLAPVGATVSADGPPPTRSATPPRPPTARRPVPSRLRRR